MKRLVSIIFFSAICAVCAAQPSYTLSQLRDSALASNISIRTARYDIQASDLQKEEAFTKYFPSVSATGVTFKADKGMLNINYLALSCLGSCYCKNPAGIKREIVWRGKHLLSLVWK